MKRLSLHRSGRPLTDRVFGYIHRLSAGDRLLIVLALAVLFISATWLLIVIDQTTTVNIPAHRGTLTEGVVGTPRFLNPVLAATRADRDLDALIYAGLTRLDENGTVVPDIAQSITVSDDGLVYNIVLHDDVVFQDGMPLTANDVAFTIDRIQDPQIGSPLRASWDGVKVEILGDHELNFVLPAAYEPFIENLTIGIMPQHIWKDASDEEFPFSQHNSEPVGAGPYKVHNVVRDSSGIPESYVLTPNTSYHRDIPKIQTLTLNFYTNESKLIDAFNTGAINSVAGLSAEAIQKLDLAGTHTVLTTPLPRTFAVFFNQNKSAALRDPAARAALDTTVDRNDLIDTVLKGYAKPLYSPIPPGFGVTPDVPTEPNDRMEAAKTILTNGGWKLNTESGVWEKKIDGVVTPLAFSIATANAPVFQDTAEYLRTKWDALGAQVQVKQFEQSDLTQAIIRPRDYEALLFGTALGRALDFYSFWHSSQRNDPGLNVALYANITTDSILEKARTTTDVSEHAEAIKQFEAEVEKETPAVFLYSPLFTYVLPKDVTGVTLTGVSEPYERFANVTDWYRDTESVWPMFQDD